MSNENEKKKENNDELESKKYKDEKIEKESQVTLMKTAVIIRFI